MCLRLDQSDNSNVLNDASIIDSPKSCVRDKLVRRVYHNSRFSVSNTASRLVNSKCKSTLLVFSWDVCRCVDSINLIAVMYPGGPTREVNSTASSITQLTRERIAHQIDTRHTGVRQETNRTSEEMKTRAELLVLLALAQTLSIGPPLT
jgi:hypothetical protein